MRKIIESALVSFDGVIGDPQAWAVDYFDEQARADALERLLASGAMLMGRRRYEAFAQVWPAQTGGYADRINSMRKYVFSSTLDRADWSNSAVIRAMSRLRWASSSSKTGRTWSSTAMAFSGRRCWHAACSTRSSSRSTPSSCAAAGCCSGRAKRPR